MYTSEHAETDRQCVNHQYSLPEQQQYFLHREVWRIHATEFGHHGEEEQGEGLSIVQR